MGKIASFLNKISSPDNLNFFKKTPIDWYIDIKAMGVRQQFGLICIIIPFVTYFVFTFNKDPTGSSLGITFLLFLIWFVQSLIVKILMLSNKYFYPLNISAILAYIALLINIGIVQTEPSATLPYVQQAMVVLFFFGWPLVDIIDLIWQNLL